MALRTKADLIEQFALALATAQVLDPVDAPIIWSYAEKLVDEGVKRGYLEVEEK